jgi:Fic family protein
MTTILSKILEKKRLLDNSKPMSQETIANLSDWFKVELTYTSNAIEGNTLSRAETALVVEKGLTVEGKTLQEHLEAVNHAQAYEWIKQQTAQKVTAVSHDTILHLHRLILQKMDDTNAGRYRTVPVRIAGSTVVMPNPAKVPELMAEFISWLHQHQTNPVTLAVDAHFKFVSIHPFIDGNGRTGRLLMNLLLIQSGFPPAIIRKEDRNQYIKHIEKGQLGGLLSGYHQFMFEAVDRSLDIYLDTQQRQQKSILLTKKSLLKIGEVALLTNESVPTIRHWTNEGLLTVEEYTPSGYQLYLPNEIEKAKKIRKLQQVNRLTLAEIKRKLT